MNLAIAITASQYKPPQINLPACDYDGKLITTLFDNSIDFDDKLIITDIHESAIIKKRLTEFISLHKGKDIEQVFFYFSGHGNFTGDEMFYLFPDYEKKSHRQTSLENSELDSLLRGLKPNIAVKIIDACHSGVPYIKDSEAFQNYIKGTKDEFNKCYFMFSSHLDQSSYQNEEFSFFTRSFAEAIAKHSTESIRFKDIIDYVSDSFSGNSRQTPFFVVQADFTEPFCKINDTLRNRLCDLLSNASAGAQKPEKKHDFESLKESVAHDAERYCTQEETAAILEQLANITTEELHQGEGAELFKVELLRHDDYSEIPQIGGIANWLDKNQHNLFVEIQYDTRLVRYEDPISKILRPFSTSADEPKYKEKIVSEPAGLKPSTPMPYYCLKVTAIPLYPNLSATVCYIVPLVSETDLQLFIGLGMYKKMGWSERVLKGDLEWHTSFMQLKDSNLMRKQLKDDLAFFWAFTLNPIKKQFGLIKEEIRQEDIDTESDPNSLDETNNNNQSKDGAGEENTQQTTEQSA